MNHYLCSSWQGLLQVVIYLVSRGYYYHNVGTYPEKKRGRWLHIDKKLIATYQCEKSKHQRVRMKKRGEARIMFLRWENIRVLLHTDGKLPPGLPSAGFRDIRASYAEIPVSERIRFFVYIDRRSRQVTARLTRESYMSLKIEIEEICRIGKVYEIVNVTERLNGLPGWRGIHEQKVNLAKLALKWARREGKGVRYAQMEIRTKRKVHDVFAK